MVPEKYRPVLFEMGSRIPFPLPRKTVRAPSVLLEKASPDESKSKALTEAGVPISRDGSDSDFEQEKVSTPSSFTSCLSTTSEKNLIENPSFFLHDVPVDSLS